MGTETQELNTPQSDRAIVVIPADKMDEMVKQIKERESKYFRKGLEWIPIGKGKHLMIEGWQTLGNFFGLSSKTWIVEEIYEPDEVTVKRIKAAASIIRCDTGGVIAGAEAIATTVGMTKKMKREISDHEVFGMAQTRAASRAYSNFLRGIARKLNFMGTPAEDMEKDTKKITPSEKKDSDGKVWADALAKAKKHNIDVKKLCADIGVPKVLPSTMQTVIDAIDAAVKNKK